MRREDVRNRTSEWPAWGREQDKDTASKQAGGPNAEGKQVGKGGGVGGRRLRTSAASWCPGSAAVTVGGQGWGVPRPPWGRSPAGTAARAVSPTPVLQRQVRGAPRWGTVSLVRCIPPPPRPLSTQLDHPQTPPRRSSIQNPGHHTAVQLSPHPPPTSASPPPPLPPSPPRQYTPPHQTHQLSAARTWRRRTSGSRRPRHSPPQPSTAARHRTHTARAAATSATRVRWPRMVRSMSSGRKMSAGRATGAAAAPTATEGGREGEGEGAWGGGGRDAAAALPASVAVGGCAAASNGAGDGGHTINAIVAMGEGTKRRKKRKGEEGGGGA